MDELATLGIMQAIYNVVKDEVSTSRVGNVRDAANNSLREDYEASGGAIKSHDIVINGETVGSLTASKTEGIEIEDGEALHDWLEANGYIVHQSSFGLSDLDEDELDELWAWARNRWPEHVREVEEVDESWRDHVGHAGSDVIDSNGEIIQGVKWVNKCGTIRISGCKWTSDPTKRTSKYAAVGDVLGRMGLSTSQVIGLIGGE